MTADRYEITFAQSRVEITDPFGCVLTLYDGAHEMTAGAIRQQARDITEWDRLFTAVVSQSLPNAPQLWPFDGEQGPAMVAFAIHQLRTDLAAAVARAEQAEARLARNTCEHCDGTGDVHTPTGEWVGECDCVYAQNNKLRAFKSAVEAAPVVACVSYVDAWKVFVRIPNAPMPPIGTELIAKPAKD